MTEKTSLETRVEYLEKKTEKHESKLETLVRFQSWLLGAAAGVGLVVGVVWETIKDKINIQ